MAELLLLEPSNSHLLFGLRLGSLLFWRHSSTALQNRLGDAANDRYYGG